MAQENTILNQQQVQIFLTVLTGKKATYQMVNNLIKHGLPCKYNPWTLRAEKEFSVDEVLAFFSAPRECKVPSAQGVRTVVRPGVTPAEERVRAALAEALKPRPRKVKAAPAPVLETNQAPRIKVSALLPMPAPGEDLEAQAPNGEMTTDFVVESASQTYAAEAEEVLD